MKNSWTKTFRRLAAGAVVAGSMAFYYAMCYAQIAYDSAADPVYSAGWLSGSNGGWGFGPWNFDGTYGNPTGQPGYDNPGDRQEIDNGFGGGCMASAINHL
jgi:hypothetical protein